MSYEIIQFFKISRKESIYHTFMHAYIYAYRPVNFFTMPLFGIFYRIKIKNKINNT